MWIRSQNKYLLININYVNVDESNRIWGDSACLGEYSTEEKALKVLDEIQERIEYPEASLISPTKLQNYYRLSSVGHFYQMPQDEDVEV